MTRTWKEDPTSRRKSPRPIGWKALRKKIFERDGYACQLRLSGFCIGSASEVDHIGDRDDHSEDNLRSACPPCHRTRTAGQAAAARHDRLRAAAAKADPHPGLLPAPAVSSVDTNDDSEAGDPQGWGAPPIDTSHAPGTA